MTVALVRQPESLASGMLPARSPGLFFINLGEPLSLASRSAPAGSVRSAHRITGSLLIGLAFGTGSEYLLHTPSLVEVLPGSYPRDVEITAQSGYRSRELKFRETNPEVFRRLAGRWVVLDGEAIAAHGTDPLVVVAEARAKGIRVPYVFYVEELRDDTAWIGL